MPTLHNPALKLDRPSIQNQVLKEICAMIFQENKRAMVTVIAVLGFVSIISVASAGQVFSKPGVVISLKADGSGYAEGTLGGIRNTANNVERLLCSVKRTEILNAAGDVAANSTVTSCSARDANNQTVMCRASTDTIGNQLNGIANDSLVTFYFNNKGTCTAINIYSSSSMERKKP
jgi:hypothetical protein